MLICILVFCVAGILSPGQAAAGTSGAVSGWVVDKDTGEPLPDVHVLVTPLPLFTVTDAQGRFALGAVPAGRQQATFSHVGYRTETLDLAVAPGDSLDLAVRLEPDLLPMPEVIVTARGRAAAGLALGGTAGALDAADLTERPLLSLAEAASALPGVWLGTDMPWSARPHIRGLSREHVVFLVNGNRVSTTTELAAQYGTVPPADVERLEVLKGPVSVLYGTGSTGGIVNAIPHSGRFAPQVSWTSAATASYESAAHGLSGYARASVGAPRFFLLGSQAYRDYGSYRDGAGRRVANSQFADRQSHVHAGVRLTETQTAEVRCQWFAARDVGIPGGGAAFPATATATYPATRRTLAEITWSRTRPQAPWRQSELRLFVQTIDRRVEVVPHTVSYLPASATAPFRRVRPLLIQPSADHDARGVRWNNTVRTGRHTLVFGVDAWEKRLRSHRRRVTEIAVLAPDSTVLRTSTTAVEDRSLPNSAFLPFGLYLEDELALSARAALVAGVRIDRIRITGEKTYVTYVPATEAVLWDAATETDYSLSGQVRLSYRFGTHLEGYANLARSFRAPSLEERFLFVDLGSTVRWGDPALRSEDGLFAELGLSAQSDRLRATGQVFANRILDMVIERPALYEGRPALRKANAGEALLWGWEAGLGHTPRSDVLLSASAASVRGTDEKENTPLPAMPPLTGSLGARCGNRRWLAADLELAAPQRRVAAGESTTGGHLTLGVSAGLERIAWGGAAHRLTAGVRNALDAAYRDHLATSRGTPLTAPGRSVFVTWSVER